jgi:hypothetical protein
MSAVEGSYRFVYVRMEMVRPGGETTTTGWTIEEDKRVAVLLTETWGKGWESHGYRLAYGVLKGMLEVPREVEWVSPVLSEQYDPTLRELFVNTTLGSEEEYYLLISNLDTSRVDDHWVEKAVKRFSALYQTVPDTSLRGDGLEQGEPLKNSNGKRNNVYDPTNSKKPQKPSGIGALLAKLEALIFK